MLRPFERQFIITANTKVPQHRTKDPTIYQRLRSAARFVRTKIRMSYLDLGGGPSDSVFLAGGGRGGTTWVSEIVNYKNDYRDIFEPFNASYVPIAKPFDGSLYVRPTDADPRLLDPARAILSGRVRSDWSDQYNRRIVAKKRIIKDIRVNLCLCWLKRHFPEMPTILLLRHPGAVVSSRLALHWPVTVGPLLAQPQLMEDHLAFVRDELERVRDPFEHHVFAWCVENYVPLRQFRRGEVHLAFYELLCERPEDELTRLGEFLGVTFDRSVFDRLKVPSSQTPLIDSAILTGASLTEGWRKRLTAAQLRRAGEILSLFGLDKIYAMDSGLPDLSGALSMMASAEPLRAG